MSNKNKPLEKGAHVYCDQFGFGTVKRLHTNADNGMSAIVVFEHLEVAQTYTMDGKWIPFTSSPGYDLDMDFEFPPAWMRNIGWHSGLVAAGFAVGYICRWLTLAAC